MPHDIELRTARKPAAGGRGDAAALASGVDMTLPLELAQDYFRHCPGEDQIKISNAVCKGRRRVNFPKCRGCQFNDEEKKLAAPAERGNMSAAESPEVIAKVFKAYDVRAVYPEPLSETLAWRIGHATAQFLRSKLTGMSMTAPNAKTIVVGRDIRTHSPLLQGAFIEGARTAGMDVIDIGLIDTSQIYFAVNHLGAAGGVQTTASHNPAHYNGFKICQAGGKPVGAGTGLESIRELVIRTPKHQSGATARLLQMDLAAPYKTFVRGFLTNAAALSRPIKIAVDASNGSAGKWFPLLFGDLPGLDVIPLNFEHDGTFVHEPNPLVEANLTALRKAVKDNGADLGACFDGDADRCVFLDEKGNTIRSDYLTALLARVFLEKHPGAAVVYDLRSSRVVKEEIERAGGKPIRERVGHAFMKKALADHNAVLGGELSGHFYFRDNWFCDSGMIIFAHLLNVLTARGGTLGEAIKPLKRLQTSGEINFENPNADEAIEKILAKFSDAESDQLDGVTVQYPDWWFNIRKSNTEPLLRLNLEARTKKLMEEKLKELTPLLGHRVEH